MLCIGPSYWHRVLTHYFKHKVCACVWNWFRVEFVVSGAELKHSVISICIWPW